MMKLKEGERKIIFKDLLLLPTQTDNYNPISILCSGKAISNGRGCLGIVFRRGREPTFAGRMS